MELATSSTTPISANGTRPRSLSASVTDERCLPLIVPTPVL
ncbi:hypothetical protein HSR122_1407 [Halapricum desulfuricans]|uniref:Uncharacterized protein n=1 Tax=Halapricum desulfuricans TaxID=2841257 RepID=A0A897NCL4_9EURY|nr:hypothetical protein HSR122_1407 [Halapricum desulfuricans]